MRQASQQDARQIAEEVWTQREDKSNQEQMLQRFNSLDERFDKKFTDAESPEYNATNAWLYQNVAMELASALDAHIQANGTSIGFDSDTIAKEAIKRFDELIDSIVADKAKKLATELGYNPNDVKSLMGDKFGSNTPKMWWEQLKPLVVGCFIVTGKENTYTQWLSYKQLHQ